ncbi:MAG TPA: hypothetical protein VF142_23290 [Longimicrobium sp.]
MRNLLARGTCSALLWISPLAVAAGCAVAPRSGAPATPALRIVSQLRGPYHAEFTLRDGREARALRTTSFVQDAGEGAPHSPWQPLPAGSRVDVEVTLLGDGDAPLATGRVSIPRAEREWYYEAQVQVVRFSPGVPMPRCMGCQGEARFPVRPAAGLTPSDSLVVTWSARHATRPMPPA